MGEISGSWINLYDFDMKMFWSAPRRKFHFSTLSVAGLISQEFLKDRGKQALKEKLKNCCGTAVVLDWVSGYRILMFSVFLLAGLGYK